jgi:hypothetical protein
MGLLLATQGLVLTGDHTRRLLMTEEEYLKQLEEEWQARQDLAADFFDDLSAFEDTFDFD